MWLGRKGYLMNKGHGCGSFTVVCQFDISWSGQGLQNRELWAKMCRMNGQKIKNREKWGAEI